MAPAISKEFFAAHFYPDGQPWLRRLGSGVAYRLAALLFNAFALPQRHAGALRTIRYAGDLVEAGQERYSDRGSARHAAQSVDGSAEVREPLVRRDGVALVHGLDALEQDLSGLFHTGRQRVAATGRSLGRSVFDALLELL